MVRWIMFVVALSMLSGCTLLKRDEYHQATIRTTQHSESKISNKISDEYHQATINAIQQSESKTSSKIDDLKRQLSSQLAHIYSFNDQISSLKTQVIELTTQIRELKKIADRPKRISEIRPQSTQPVFVRTRSRHEVILGEIEKITIDAVNQTFDARIDTGAATSSLNAVDIEKFERDGKNWIRFHLSGKNGVQNKDHWIEAPVLRYARIRQSSSEQTERRAVIELWVKLGDIHEKAQFTLADRSHMDCPILLGREFIRDIAVVDVSHKYIQTGTM